MLSSVMNDRGVNSWSNDFLVPVYQAASSMDLAGTAKADRKKRTARKKR